MLNTIYTYTVFCVFPSDFQAKPHMHIKRKCVQNIENSAKLSLFFCFCTCVSISRTVRVTENCRRLKIYALLSAVFSPKLFFSHLKVFNELRSSCWYERV